MTSQLDRLVTASGLILFDCKRNVPIMRSRLESDTMFDKGRHNCVVVSFHFKNVVSQQTGAGVALSASPCSARIRLFIVRFP